MKLIGEWSSLAGGRVFRLVESDDPMAMFGAAYAWTDLGNLEVFPVAETDAILKAIGGGS